MARNDNQLALDEVQDLLRTISLIIWLLGLDEAWTREAARQSEPATRDDDRVEQLGGVVDQLDQLLGEIGALGPRLSEIFGSRDALLREGYEGLVADGDRLTADERGKLRAFVEEHGQGDFVGLVTNAAYQIGAQSGTQRQNLRTEYDGIRGGGASEGDIDPEFEAWVQAVALAATIALGPGAGGVVELAGAVIGFIVDLF